MGMKSDKLTIFGGGNWGSYRYETSVLQRVLPTYTQQKIRFRVTEIGKQINVTYRYMGQGTEPVKEFGTVLYNQGAKIKSPEYVLTNDEYTEEAIRGFWYDDNGEMYEDDYSIITDQCGSEFEKELRLLDKQYFFTRELGKEMTDITAPFGHLSWIISDNDQENESNLIAFDYIVSDCRSVVLIDSTIDTSGKNGHIGRFEIEIIPIEDATEVAKGIVTRAENVLAECWSDYEVEHNVFRELNLYTEGGSQFIESINSEIGEE